MTTNGLEGNKTVVRLLVDRVINQWRMDELACVLKEEAARKAQDDFESFRKAFPDWQMELKEMVAEGDTVVARFKCHGTHRGEWRGDEPTGKKMSVDEDFFFRFEGRSHSRHGALEDTWSRMRQLGLW